MRKIREPKQLETYLPADEAAAALEELAAKVRALGQKDPNRRLVVKWSINLSFWNPAWNEKDWPGELIFRAISYVSGRERE